VQSSESHASFVVRVSGDEIGGVTGVVICVRTGERTAFRGAQEAGLVLARAIAKATRRWREEPPALEP
jgi:hypothetical protein